MPALSPILTIMTRAAEKAAKSLLRDFGEVEQLQVSVKGPGDFVSAADRRAEQILHQELSKARPDYSFLMEETGAHGSPNAEFRFIIDPLDGTTNFLHGIPHWAISIALEKAGEMIVGVVYDAVKNEMFYAERGNGAYMNDRRIRVSGRKELPLSLTLGSSGQLDKDPNKRAYKDIALMTERTGGFRIYGSAALDLSYVACGRAESCVHYELQPWDSAAGVVIVKEAGGKTIGLKDENDPIFSGALLAGNQFILPQMRELLGV